MPFSRVITNDSSKITVIYLGSVDLHPVFLPNPSTNNGEREHRRHIEHIIERSMKNNHSWCLCNYYKFQIIILASWWFLWNLSTLWQTNFLLLYLLLYGVTPRCRWTCRWIFWCRLCDAASLKQQLLFRITFAVKLTVIADLPSLVLESIVLSPWKLLDVMGRESSL